MATRNQLNPPPLRKITDFKSKLAGGGARSNLFEVELSFPSAVSVDGLNDILNKARFLVKAANLPASNVAPIEVPFRGRVLKVAGDRTFDTWSVTIINDENFKLRNAFETWMDAMSRTSTNVGATNPSSYMATAYVHQLGRGANAGINAQKSTDVGDGSNIKPLKSYKFVDIFPTEVGSIELSYDSSDSIEEFQVTFQVQHWENYTAVA